MRRSAVVALVVLVVSGLVFIRPAQAHNDVCMVSGVLELDAKVAYYPIGARVTNVAMHFANAAGACGVTSALTAAGRFSGRCGAASGSGATTDGHGFEFVVVGDSIDFTGGVIGMLSMVPDVTTAHSCAAAPGASRFLITGSVVLGHA